MSAYIQTPASHASEYPGINIPLDNVTARTFPIGLPEIPAGDTMMLHMTELAMMMIMDQITDKPAWHEKVFDEVTVEKWRDEVSRKPEDGLYARLLQDKCDLDRQKVPQPKLRIMSGPAFEYCIAELRVKARYYTKSHLIPTLDSSDSTIVKSDTLVDTTLRLELQRAFDALCQDQGTEVDWHPRSGEMVRDLVHPSLFPFVFGRSKFIQEEVVGVSNAFGFLGWGQEVELHKKPKARAHWNPAVKPEDSVYWSNVYQWLPSNVAFSAEGNAKITSYVNNLNPAKYGGIYQTLEKLVDKAIPAWNQCLREYRGGMSAGAGRSRPRCPENLLEITNDNGSDSNDELWTPRFSVEGFMNADIALSEDEWRRLGSIGDIPLDHWHMQKRPRFEDEFVEDTQYELDNELARLKWDKIREAIRPEPLQFIPFAYEPKERLCDKFKHRGLQIIVKMASIELTPDKPMFPAGGWHIEGQMNEKICATALYYLDSHNVTPSHLSFRTQSNGSNLSHVAETLEQDEFNWLENVFGTSLGSLGVALQTFGDVRTPQGRLVAFPNTIQHRVSPFRLRDPTKPGHRRFIALWLVDPHRRIVSTANVPPQQKHWLPETLLSGEDVVSKLDMNAEGFMDMEEAALHRLRLMDERTRSVAKAEDQWTSVEYNLCEH